MDTEIQSEADSVRQFFAILGHVLPFYLPDYPENQNFEKLK